ncbi:MAG TPA: MFS transporter [Steroidobacteraceae bacterium]|nr:MFS transporter [Steroidobacteraceae bacterium]
MSAAQTWGAAQRHVVVASYLGWMLDAFDFFLVVFVLKRIADDFGVEVKSVTWAITCTLAMRPVGAFLFGRLADHFGRRPALMASVLLYSIMEFASAFAPSLSVFIVLRALYGIAMGGEWGVGASLAFESVPVRSRGVVSGLLQAGYPSGYLLAAIVFGLLFEHIGWRGMFMVGAAPALLVLYIRSKVPESQSWIAAQQYTKALSLRSGIAGHWLLAAYAVVLMTAFNFFSHGTQDLFPTMLASQRGFSTGTIARIAIVYNIGAICGGLCFGTLSSRIGRRRAIALAALMALPALPFWGFARAPVSIAIAAFVLQFMVQGAWGVVPVHLNELSPQGLRATFPGFVYQLGNLIASLNAPLQSSLADRHGSSAHPDYAFALTLVCAVVALCLVVLALLGPERRDVRFGSQ